MSDSLKLPGFTLPPAPLLPLPVLEVPRAELPSYVPLMVPAMPKADKPPARAPLTAKNAEPEPVAPPDLRQLIREALRQAEAKASKQQVVEKVQAAPEPLKAVEITEVVVPGTAVKIPVPKAEILSAAATTSVISVGATLAATSVFKRVVQVLKPTLKALAAKAQKLRGKKVETWARRRLRERHQRRGRRRANLP